MEIVIVDDEIASLNTFLSNIIDNTHLSYRMYKNNPLSALEHIKTHHVDGAFLDINMPEIDGITLAQKMIEAEPQLKIVFISGYTQNEEEIRAKIGKNLLGFCYKPYDEKEIGFYISAVCDGDIPKVRMQMFPTFEMYANGKVIEFQRKKCKELLALLIDHRGATVTMGEAIACLWPDKEENLSKRLYRDAVVRLRLLLNECGLIHLVKFGRAAQRLVLDYVTCDMWDFIDGKEDSSYLGEYLVNYEWSMEKQCFLDSLADKRKSI